MRPLLALEELLIPDSYNWLPPSDLPSAVLELANLCAAYARDVKAGTHTAPTFEDTLWLHRLFDKMDVSSTTGQRVSVD